MKSTLTIQVNHPAGLHARPASLFVQTANKFVSDIFVQNLTEDSEQANGKSILGVLTLGVCQGHEIMITAEGADAEDSLNAFRALIDNNFGEG